MATVDANGVVGRNTTVLTDIAALQTASTGFQGSLSALGGQVNTLFDLRELDRRDFKKGVAAAVAMGNAAFPSAPGKTSYVLNGSVFRGEAAVGGSLMHRFDSDTPIALGVGFSGSSRTFFPSAATAVMGGSIVSGPTTIRVSRDRSVGGASLIVGRSKWMGHLPGGGSLRDGFAPLAPRRLSDRQGVHAR